MIFKVPKELAEQSVLACADCHNPVPNDMLDDAQHGRLGPCPVCGSERLMDNPNSAMTYAHSEEYPDTIGMVGLGEIFQYLHVTMFVPKINTEKKKRTHPLLELLEAAISR
jgi:DNA-directed RNA polymerase subunit RPC12/RpoP